MQSQLAGHALDPPSVPLAGLQHTPEKIHDLLNCLRSAKIGHALVLQPAALLRAGQIWDMAQTCCTMTDQFSIIEVAKCILQHELIGLNMLALANLSGAYRFSRLSYCRMNTTVIGLAIDQR